MRFRVFVILINLQIADQIVFLTSKLCILNTEFHRYKIAFYFNINNYNYDLIIYYLLFSINELKGKEGVNLQLAKLYFSIAEVCTLFFSPNVPTVF